MNMYEVIPVEKVIQYVTIQGLVVPETSFDRMLLCLMMRKFTFKARKACCLMWKHKFSQAATTKLITKELDAMYADSAVKHAKLVIEGAEAYGGYPWRHMRKFFLFCRGSKWEEFGNRNIKCIDFVENENYFKTKIKYIGSLTKWINCRVYFGKRYTSVMKELWELAKNHEEGIPVKISYNFDKKRFYCHVSVPLWLYLKYFRIYDKPLLDVDRYAVGADLGSTFVKWVVVDVETWKPIKWFESTFPQISQPGYPKEKAWNEIVQEVDKALQWLYNYGVSIVFLENLFKVKKSKKPSCKSSRTRRKVTRFMKRKLLTWLALRCLKYGFKTYLVDPKDSSLSAKYLSKYLWKVDKDYGAAYVIALRGLQYLSKHMKTYTIT